VGNAAYCRLFIGEDLSHYSNKTEDGTEMVQVTPLRRSLASSPQPRCTSCLRCFDAVGWAAGRTSGL